MMVYRDGYVPLTTHLFAADSPYLDSDAVFGVRDSLIVPFARHESRRGARRPRDGAALSHRKLRLRACSGGLSRRTTQEPDP